MSEYDPDLDARLSYDAAISELRKRLVNARARIIRALRAR